MKREIKDYCIKNNLLNLETDKGRLEMKIRNQRRANTKLLNPEILDTIIEDVKQYYQYYNKK